MRQEDNMGIGVGEILILVALALVGIAIVAAGVAFYALNRRQKQE
jgi:hypothetical protein